MPDPEKIRTLLADDEAPARARLRQLLRGEPDVVIVGECANGRQALESIQREKPDLAFLDVQMPRLSGVQLCQAVREAGGALPLVIFVTAYDQYALAAFEVHAIDYLLKPFDRDRFGKALARARDQLRQAKGRTVEERLTALLDQLRADGKRTDRLVFKQNGRVLFIRPEEIQWIEADGNYVRVHTRSEAHYLRESLAGLEAQLPPEQFMRISRSSIVNLDCVKELQSAFYGDYVVLLQNGSRLQMSRNYRDRLQAMLGPRA